MMILLSLAVLFSALFTAFTALKRSSANTEQLRRHRERIGELNRLLERVSARLHTLERDARGAALAASTAAYKDAGKTQRPAVEPVDQQEPATKEAVDPSDAGASGAVKESQAGDDQASKELTTLEALRAAREHATAIGDKAIPKGPPVERADQEKPDKGQDDVAAGDEVPLDLISASVNKGGSAPATRVEKEEADHARRLTLEEVLAGRVFVWIGAVALVLTAAFLLKIGFDAGIITEPVRVIAAGVFGIFLWAVGEWARHRANLIAQALCGAAVAVLYGAILAGQNYGLFGTQGAAFAFALTAFVTTAAIVLSLRHGQAVAVLGMVGGFMLPPLLSVGLEGPSAGMVLYLLALEAGILAVTGRRGWFGISALTLAFTMLWSLGYTLVGDSPGQRTLTALLVVGTAAAYLIQTARLHARPGADARTRARMVGLSIAAVCSAVCVVALLGHRGGYMPRDLWTLGLVASGVLALARLDRRFLTLPFVVMGLSLLVLVSGAQPPLTQDNPLLFNLTATGVGYGLLFLIGGYVCQFGSRDRRVFTLMSLVAGPAYFAVIIFTGRESFGMREAWWPFALMLAGLYALGAVPMLRKRVAEYDWPIAGYALAAFGFVCVAIVQGMHHPRIAVCLALASAVAALVDRRLFIRPLLIASCVVGGLAAAMLVLPGPFLIQIKGIALLNTLLPVYALPALGFGIIAWCADRAGENTLARWMAWLCTATVAFLLVLLTRQAYHPADFSEQAINLYEYASYACVLMLGGYVGLRVAGRLNLAAVREASVATGVLGAAVGLIGALLLSNPMLHPDTPGGWGIAFGLVALYLLPAWLMRLWSRQIAVLAFPPLRDTLHTLSFMLVVLFVSLQLRNLFHANNLHAFSLGMFECTTYAIAWMLMGSSTMLFNRNRNDRISLYRAGQLVFGIGLATTLLGNVVLLNPLWVSHSVGALPVLNGLWYLYLPSIFVLALIAHRNRMTGNLSNARLAGFTAIGIGFILASLQVRQAFSGDGVLLLDQLAGSAERYTYSLVWVLVGAGLLVAGIVTRLETLRYGSLAVLLIAVGKVFLIDTASLDNLYRVFSFFGLGVTLVGLGYLYQRLIFRRPAL